MRKMARAKRAMKALPQELAYFKTKKVLPQSRKPLCKNETRSFLSDLSTIVLLANQVLLTAY